MEDAGPAVRYEVTERGVALITLNRPRTLNALSPEVIDELGRSFERADRDPRANCAVLTGAGRGFCSGGDVGAMAQADTEPATDPAGGAQFDGLIRAQERMRQNHAHTALRIYELSKPTIALVNGPCAGGGLGLACACDIRIASDRAMFTTAYARIGRSGDAGGTFFLRQLLGPSRAKELYFTADRLDAAQALALGLVDHVYPHEEFADSGIALAERIAAGPTQAFAFMKQAFRAADRGDLREVLNIESMNMPLSGLGSEGRRFIVDFLATRRKHEGS